MYCTHCGSHNQDTAYYCQKCGTALHKTTSTVTEWEKRGEQECIHGGKSLLTLVWGLSIIILVLWVLFTLLLLTLVLFFALLPAIIVLAIIILGIKILTKKLPKKI